MMEKPELWGELGSLGVWRLGVFGVEGAGWACGRVMVWCNRRESSGSGLGGESCRLPMSRYSTHKPPHSPLPLYVYLSLSATTHLGREGTVCRHSGPVVRDDWRRYKCVC